MWIVPCRPGSTDDEDRLAVALKFRFTTDLWEYQGETPWFFLTVPAEYSDEIRETAPPRRGFGSVEVVVTVGDSTWKTSVFPDKQSGCYLLPVKRAIRESEGLIAGHPVLATLSVRPD